MASFIFLAVLMLISFMVSEYEYYQVEGEYSKAFNQANKDLGTNTTSKMTSRRNETKDDQDIELIKRLDKELGIKEEDDPELQEYYKIRNGTDSTSRS